MSISLPSHLRSTLDALPEILPEDLCSRLSIYLVESSSEIPYSILSDISKWSRSEDARCQLRDQNLDPNDYSMIALLAGTITSPSSKLPPYIPPEDAAQIAKRSTNDRQAITAIMNALLSIGGAGYAGWWASGRTSWRDEWRVLFGLLVSSVVAVSEALLYLIWQSRRNALLHLRAQPARKKKEEGSEVEEREENRGDAPDGLRQRKTLSAKERRYLEQ